MQNKFRFVVAALGLYCGWQVAVAFYHLSLPALGLPLAGVVTFGFLYWLLLDPVGSRQKRLTTAINRLKQTFADRNGAALAKFPEVMPEEADLELMLQALKPKAAREAREALGELHEAGSLMVAHADDPKRTDVFTKFDGAIERAETLISRVALAVEATREVRDGPRSRRPVRLGVEEERELK